MSSETTPGDANEPLRAEIRSLPDLLEALRRIDRGSVEYELERLLRESDWARAQLPVQVGDRVVITGTIPIGADSGWYPYREALAVGATGTALNVSLSTRSGRWRADVVLDRCWSVVDWNGETRRYWDGPEGDTPEGYQPPSCAEGSHKLFWIGLDRLERQEGTAAGDAEAGRG